MYVISTVVCPLICWCFEQLIAGPAKEIICCMCTQWDTLLRTMFNCLVTQKAKQRNGGKDPVDVKGQRSDWAERLDTIERQQGHDTTCLTQNAEGKQAPGTSKV